MRSHTMALMIKKSSMTILLALAFASIAIVAEGKVVHLKGQANAWQIPSSPSEFNQWASTKRFRVGDVLVFEYDQRNDSLLVVTKENYDSCNTARPIKSYNDGDTFFKFDRSGPFFFISGADGHCAKGQKLEVVVMSDHHHHSKYAPAPAPHSGAGAMTGHGGGVALAVGFVVGGMMV